MPTSEVLRKLYVCGPYCFVPSPVYTLYHRTDRCVAFVECPLCKAAAGHMCQSPDGDECASTHAKRRRLYTSTLAETGEDRNANVVTITIEDVPDS